MEICKSIVKHDDEYLNLYEALPALAITEELTKIHKKEKVDTDNMRKKGGHKKLATGMKSLGDHRVVLVQLVSGEKCDDETSAQMSAQCDAITESLAQFKWEEFAVGTKKLVIP